MVARRFTLIVAVVLGLVLAGSVPLAAAATPVHWSGPYLGDHSPPMSTPSSLSGVTCTPDGGACLAVGPAGTIAYVDAEPAVTESGLDHGAALTGAACPAASLCVVTEPTALLTSTHPFGARPRWRHVAVALPGADAYSGITCASATLCVAWTDSDTIEVSTDPAGGRSAWRAETLPGEVFALACVPGTTECVASLGDTNGASAAVAVSSDPALGTGGWRARGLGDLKPMTALACPSTTLCVGTTATGTLQTSTNPPADGAAWTSGQLVTGTPPGLVGLACASASQCVAAVSDGSILTSSDPAAGAASYTRTAVLDPAGFGTANVNEIACTGLEQCFVPDRTPGLATVSLGPPASASIHPGVAGFTRITGLACPARDQCLGVDAGGGIMSSYHPARGPGAWFRSLAPGADRGLAAISCPTTHFCAAVGGGGYVAATRHPVPGSTRWTHFVLRTGGHSPRLAAISCPSARLCVAGGSADGLLASTRPRGGPNAWRLIGFGGSHAAGWDAVSCPSRALCVAGDRRGRIAVGTHPLRGARAWRRFAIARRRAGSRADGITAVACPSRRFCLAGDARGAVHWSTRPGGGRRAWHAARIAGARLIAADCRSARFCVAVDDHDHAYATSDPRGGRQAWHAATLSTGRFPLGTPAQESLTALACAPRGLCVAGSGVGVVFPGATGPAR